MLLYSADDLLRGTELVDRTKKAPHKHLDTNALLSGCECFFLKTFNKRCMSVKRLRTVIALSLDEAHKLRPRQPDF